MSKRLALLITVVALGCGLSAANAQASPITGGFSIVGRMLPVGPSGTLADATGLDFIDLLDWTNTPSPGVAGDFVVASASGDFLSVLGSIGTIEDLTFAGSPNTPIAGFETVGNFTFDLLSVAVSIQNADLLWLTGTGVFHSLLDPTRDTAGTFNFAATEIASTFAFAASTGTAVPEPASIALTGLGLALFGFAVMRRRAGRASGCGLVV
jgi:PEP-CTERM motif